MTKLERLMNDYPEQEFLVADGFDRAIIGVEVLSGKVVYDCGIMVEILTKDDEMTEEEAIEYIDYNVVNAFVGDNTPIFVNVLEDEKENPI